MNDTDVFKEERIRNIVIKFTMFLDGLPSDSELKPYAFDFLNKSFYNKDYLTFVFHYFTRMLDEMEKMEKDENFSKIDVNFFNAFNALFEAVGVKNG